jgi:hypothetical protein
MSLKIGHHLFTGPMNLAETKVRANQIPVVFAVVCKEGAPWNPVFRLIDVDVSDAGGTVFAGHPHRSDWEKAASGTLSLYIFEPEKGQRFEAADRAALVADLRRTYEPPRGVITLTGGT